MRIIIEIEGTEATATVSRAGTTAPPELLALAAARGAEDAGPAPALDEALRAQLTPLAPEAGVEWITGDAGPAAALAAPRRESKKPEPTNRRRKR